MLASLGQNTGPAAPSPSSYSTSLPLPASLLQPRLRVPTAGPQLPSPLFSPSCLTFPPQIGSSIPVGLHSMRGLLLTKEQVA